MQSLLRPLVAALVLLTSTAAAQSADLRAAPYDPQCGDDTACAVWAGFRREHPFPYQSFAAAKSSDGALVVIISEPAPTLSRADLETRVRAEFGAELIAYSNRRWMIGEDGWVEDAVLKLRWTPAQAALADPLRDRTLRTRIAALHTALYGTAYGGDLEAADRPFAPIALGAAPDLSLSPAELNTWLTDAATRWRPIGNSRDPARSYPQLLAANAQGAFIDAEGQLVILIAPAATRTSDEAIAALRAPFRRFAIASDTLIGGAWSEKGDVTLIGRARRAPPTAVAPLRFETFAQLAREQRGELQQSYERDIPLSGKLLSGPHALRDWAPILLSPSLANTEFGALLNITDQFLKSWSEAGRIQYVYFDYPLRPQNNEFVFGAERLSRLVAEETGVTGVLYNWNTAGAATAMSFDAMNVLAAGRTSALPVTYGSELYANAALTTGDQLPRLRALENQAYDYFVARRDPNLARVVSYTLMYQVFRAASPAPAAAPDAERLSGSRAVLRQAMRNLLDALLDGRARPQDPALQSIVQQEAPALRGKLRAFMNTHREYRDRDALAALLIDPHTPDAALSAEASDLAASIQDSAFTMTDLAAISTAFASSSASDTASRIKTPSIVLSWDDTDLMSALMSIGGHNINARALRIVIDLHAQRMTLTDTPTGKVLRVPQADAARVSANAHAIARLVEHEGGDVAAIQRLIAPRPAAAPTRNRAEALGEAPAEKAPDWSGRLGDEE